jgi:hypothetical protein
MIGHDKPYTVGEPHNMSMSMPQPQPRIVAVTVNPSRIDVSPDSLRVTRDTEVAWRIDLEKFPANSTVSIHVEFPITSPFKRNGFAATVRTDSAGNADATVSAGEAKNKGRHKYDVEIVSNGRKLKVDPWIEVD